MNSEKKEKPKIKRAELKRMIEESIAQQQKVYEKFYAMGWLTDEALNPALLEDERQKLWEIFEKFFEIVD